MSSFNLENQEKVKNLIKANIITLYPDHSELNIHFKYRDIEVSSKLNNTALNYINQIVNEREQEKVPEDVFREILINVKIDDYLKILDEEDSMYDEDEEDELDDELDEDSYDVKLHKHFPGQYLTKSQRENYNLARERSYALKILSNVENKSIYIFMSINGLEINKNYIKFNAPMLSKNQYEYMFWCVNIIDKLIKEFIEYEDEDYTDIEEDKE